MRWDRGHESPDVIDRRDEEGGGRPQIGGLLYLLPLLMRSKLGWLVILAGGAYYLFAGRLGGNAQRAAHDAPVAPGQRADHAMVEFVSFVLDDTQKTWAEIFRETWRTQRDYFYDATMHGADWQAILAKYTPLLADVLLERFVSPDVVSYAQLEAMSQAAADAGYGEIR